MTIIGELAVLITGRTEKFDRSMKRSTQITKRFSSSMKSMLAAAGVGGGIGFGIRLAAQAEKAQIAFEVLLKSSEKAVLTMKELKEFSAKTPFEFAAVQDAGRKLLAAQIPAEKLTKTLRMLGDISAITDIRLNELASIFGKMKSGNLIQGEELNQLADRGLPIFQELAKVLDTTPDKIRKLGSEGKITFADLTKAFQNLTSEGGAFFGATDRLAGSAAGKWSTLKDSLTDGLRQIGQVFLEKLDLKKFTDDMTKLTQVMTREVVPAITKAFEALPKAMEVAGNVMRGAMDTFAEVRNFFIAGGTKFGEAVGGNPLLSQTLDAKRELQRIMEQETTRDQRNNINKLPSFMRNAVQERIVAGAGSRGILSGITGPRKNAIPMIQGAGGGAGGGITVNSPMAGAAPRPTFSGAATPEESRNLMMLFRGAAGLGGLFSRGSNAVGGALGGLGRAATKDTSPLGINSAVTAGSAEAIRLAAMSQQQNRAEAIQANQLDEQRGIRSLMGTLVGLVQGNTAETAFDTTGAL